MELAILYSASLDSLGPVYSGKLERFQAFL